MKSRIPDNATSSTYTYDALDRVTHIDHVLDTTHTFDYGYDSVGNRNWVKRDGGNGDVFDYDQADQVTVAKLDVRNPDTTAPGAPTIVYDANGNRNSFGAYGPVEQYATDEFNRYPSRNINGTTTNAVYNGNSNLTAGLDGSSYVYDAQNRLTSASKNGTTDTFTHDAFNRQVSRTVAGVTTYNVYDGWGLVAEYAPGTTTPSAAYLNGTGGIVKNLVNNKYYYQDASGSTSHLAGGAGALVEWYRYDLQGTPIIYNANGTQRSTSTYGVRHLFTGQQWYSELGLYDLRNRYYSPDIGRFLQADASGFNGDATNLYRYCGNNPLKSSDPSGLSGTLIQYHRDAPGSSPLEFKAWMADRHEDVGNPDLFSRSMVGAGPVFDGIVGVDANWLFLVLDPLFNRSLNPVSAVPAGTVRVGEPTAVDDSDPSDSGGSNPLSFIGNILGKIWNVPNDIVGLFLGLASLPFGGEIHFGDNAIQFTNVPFGSAGALTLGNVELYNGVEPTDHTSSYNDPSGPLNVQYGLHEMAHTFQSQVLGPLFVPIYLLNGGIGAQNPFENAADNYATHTGSWWPGGG